MKQKKIWLFHLLRTHFTLIILSWVFVLCHKYIHFVLKVYTMSKHTQHSPPRPPNPVVLFSPTHKQMPSNGVHWFWDTHWWHADIFGEFGSKMVEQFRRYWTELQTDTPTDRLSDSNIIYPLYKWREGGIKKSPGSVGQNRVSRETINQPNFLFSLKKYLFIYPPSHENTC